MVQTISGLAHRHVRSAILKTDFKAGQLIQHFYVEI